MSITVHVNGTVEFTFFLVMNLCLLIVILILVILFSSFKMSITVHVNGTVQFTFFLVMNLYLLIVILILVILFSSFKIEDGLKKHAQNVVRKKYGVVELVVIVFTFNIKFQPLFLSISWRKPL